LRDYEKEKESKIMTQYKHYTCENGVCNSSFFHIIVKEDNQKEIICAQCNDPVEVDKIGVSSIPTEPNIQNIKKSSSGQCWVNLSKFYLWDYDLKIGMILFAKIAEDEKSISFFYRRPTGASKAVKVTESGHGSGRLTIPKSLIKELMWDEGQYGFYHHKFVELHIRKLVS